jgi:hypothetical protein
MKLTNQCDDGTNVKSLNRVIGLTGLICFGSFKKFECWGGRNGIFVILLRDYYTYTTSQQQSPRVIQMTCPPRKIDEIRCSILYAAEEIESELVYSTGNIQYKLDEMRRFNCSGKKKKKKKDWKYIRLLLFQPI